METRVIFPSMEISQCGIEFRCSIAREWKKADAFRVRVSFVRLPDERVNFGDGLGDSAVDQLAGGTIPPHRR